MAIKHTIKYQTQQKTKKTQTIYSGRIKKSYPLYREDYKLNIPRIKNLISNMKTDLYTYDKLPNNFQSRTPPQKLFHNNINKFVIIKSKWNDDLELNSLTDYFTEQCRNQCAFKGSLSPIEYWKRNRDKIINMLEKQRKPVNNYWVREIMYRLNKPCNNFRVSVCLEVLRLFKPKRWLDISAGWGDRLLSGLLYKPLELYVGVDPNPCLHPHYQDMIKTFNSRSSKNTTSREFILIQDGFETAKLPNTTFDLVFSSPPFFDLEIYSGASSNSLMKYKGADGWFNGFLMPSIYKAIGYLERNGYLVLYMDEAQGTQYIPRMIKLIDSYNGDNDDNDDNDDNPFMMKNLGIFYYADTNKLRPFYCWRKIMPSL